MGKVQKAALRERFRDAFEPAANVREWDAPAKEPR